MNFLELLDEVKKIKSDHRRISTADFFEMVIEWTELAALTKILKSFFGEPRKPVDVCPNDEVESITAPYGGIWQNQTLYYQENEKEFYMVMLWPWTDGMLITVKLIRGEKKNVLNASANTSSKNFWEKLRALFPS